MNKEDIEMVCEKCGKYAEIDKEKSNKNWTVYKIKCKCGGRIIFKFNNKI